jgi:anti-sigma factor (TIGR02949 family)
MTCDELRARLHPYVDGELGVDETLDADEHAARCPRCAALVESERRFRRLLRRQPREAAPPELRAQIVAGIRRAARRATIRRWAPLPVAAAAVLLLFALLPASRNGDVLVAQLVDTHIAFAQIDDPAEFRSTDRAEVARWLRQRAELPVPVPDYSGAGIRLVGARLAEVRERPAAYVLYQKGYVLLSVFVAPGSADEAALRGERVSYRGHDYVVRQQKGYRTVAWTDGRMVFGLVSMLDYEALLECADRLRAERATAMRA